MLKWLLITLLACLFLCCPVAVLAQKNDLRTGIKVPFTVFETTDSTLTLQEIRTNAFNFRAKDSIIEKTKPNQIYWIKVDFSKELKTILKDSLWFLRSYKYEFGSLYYQENSQVKETLFGVFEVAKNPSSKLYGSGHPFNAQSLFDGKYLYLKVRKVTYRDQVSKWQFSYVSSLQNELIESYYSRKDLQYVLPVYTFDGICLVMFILTLAFFLYSKRLEFLFYTLYVLFLFLYLSSDILQLHDTLFGQYGLASYGFFQVTQVLINFFYILFVMYYLNTKVDYPKLHLALKSVAYILAVVIILDSFFLATSSFYSNIYILNIERIIMTLFGLFGMIYLLFVSKDKLGYFIVSGSFLYMIGALGLLFFKVRAYMILGSSLEILIFASGLTYKMQQENKEKLRFQRDSLVNENRALRAQMNPHFIFNSLSSIQNLITKGKKESAIKYLNKFSQLMRNLLESSFDTNVLLSDEVLLLEKYLQLEALRFNDSFIYSISMDADINPDVIEIPSLLVQPFIENAILHGLLNKSGNDKELNVHFSYEWPFLFCDVEDNGVGRSVANERNTIYPNRNKSRGIEVTQKRLELLNKSEINAIVITDKYDTKGNPTGTLVRIKIATEN